MTAIFLRLVEGVLIPLFSWATKIQFGDKPADKHKACSAEGAGRGVCKEGLFSAIRKAQTIINRIAV